MPDNTTPMSIGDIKTNVDLLNGLVTSTTNAMEVFDDAMKGLKALSKVGAVLGVFGAALDITTTFIDLATGEPSPEEKIMGMIDEVANQITGLNQNIQSAFAQAELTTALAVVNGRYGEIKPIMDTLILEVKDYRETQSKLLEETDPEKKQTLKEDIAHDENQLLTLWDQHYADYLSVIQGLVNIVTDSTPILGQNLFSLIYQVELGDPRPILMAGTIIFNDIVQMSVAFGVIRGIQRKGDPLFPKQNLESEEKYDAVVRDESEYFETQLTKVSDEMDIYLTKCKNEAPANIGLKTNKVLEEEIKDVIGKGFLPSAQILRAALSAQFPWFDFFVVFYSPVAGNNMHQYRGTFTPERGLLVKFRYQPPGTNYAQVNLFVYWVDRNQPTPLVDDKNAKGLVDWVAAFINQAVIDANYQPYDLNKIFANRNMDDPNEENRRIGFNEFCDIFYKVPHNINVDLPDLTWWVYWPGEQGMASSSSNSRRTYLKYGTEVYTDTVVPDQNRVSYLIVALY